MDRDGLYKYMYHKPRFLSYTNATEKRGTLAFQRFTLTTTGT